MHDLALIEYGKTLQCARCALCCKEIKCCKIAAPCDAYNEIEENRHATVKDDVTVAVAGIPALKGEKTTQESPGARVVHCG